MHRHGKFCKKNASFTINFHDIELIIDMIKIAKIDFIQNKDFENKKANKRINEILETFQQGLNSLYHNEDEDVDEDDKT
jgi:hypothetical protein